MARTSPSPAAIARDLPRPKPSLSGKKFSAYNFAKRLKTLKGLTPYEYICKLWTKGPNRFVLDPIHQMSGLNRQ
jgi:hypothetical protein